MKSFIAVALFALVAVAFGGIVAPYGGYYGGYTTGYAAAPIAYSSGYGYASPAVYSSAYAAPAVYSGAYASPYYSGLGYGYGAYGYLKK